MKYVQLLMSLNQSNISFTHWGRVHMEIQYLSFVRHCERHLDIIQPTSDLIHLSHSRYFMKRELINIRWKSSDSIRIIRRTHQF